MSCRFQALEHSEEEAETTEAMREQVNSKWNQIANVFTRSSKACLGFRQRKRKEWKIPDSWSAIEARCDLKKKMMDSKSPRLKARYRKQHREAHQEVKRRVWADKRDYVNNMAAQAESVAVCNEQGTVYKITKILSSMCHLPAASLVKEKQGKGARVTLDRAF